MRLTYVRIAKYEPLVELVLDPIHFAPDDAEQRLAVDQDLYTILLYLLVKSSGFVDIIEVVG